MSRREAFCLKSYVAESLSKYKDDIARCLKAIDYDLGSLIEQAKSSQHLELSKVIELLEKIKPLAHAYRTMPSDKLLKNKTVKQQEEKLIAFLQNTDIKCLEDKHKLRKKFFDHVNELLSRILSIKSTYNEVNANILRSAQTSLRCFEEKIATNIIKLSSLKTLAKEAQSAGFIPEKEKDILMSLHESVPCSLAYRYLIPHIYSSVKKEKNYSIFDRWLSMLLKCDVNDVLDEMGLYFEKSLATANESITSLDTSDGGSTKALFKDNVFEEKHVPLLTEVLARHASLWREIAIALNLPKNEVATIVSMIHSYETVVICLNKVLHAWVTKQPKQAKPPTLESLKSALQSETVGLGRAAQSTVKHFKLALFKVSEFNHFNDMQ